MGQTQSIQKINFEDIQYVLKNREQHVLINTLGSNEQNCLLPNTINELDEENILNIHVGGSQTPIYLKLNKKHQNILFFGKARLKNNDPAALDKIVAMANEAYTFFPVSRFEEEGELYLYAEHKFSIQEGVPTRLLTRIAKQFTAFFESALRCDKDRVLEL